MYERYPKGCISQGKDGGEHGGIAKEFCYGHNYIFIVFSCENKKKECNKVYQNQQRCSKTNN